MKKIINLLFLLLIINLLILSNLLIIRYNSNLNLIPTSYAKTYIDNKDNYNLIVNILKDANKNNFIKYVDYIDINFTSTIPNAPKNMVAFTLSLPQQVSFIAFYNKISDSDYKFLFIIDDLSTIDDFYFYKDFLVVEQTDNNTLDNFEERSYIEIFYNKNDTYTSIFNKNIYSTKLIKNDEDTGSSNLQYVESASIDYLDADIPRILCITTTIVNKEKLSLLNNSKEYTEIKKDIKKEIYQWDNNKEVFEITELDYTKKELN